MGLVNVKYDPIVGFVYVLVHPLSELKNNGYYTKIGFSKLHPDTGYSLAKSKPRKKYLDFILVAFGLGELDMPFCWPRDDANVIEKALQRHFSNRRRDEVGSSREIFNVSPEEVELEYKRLTANMPGSSRSETMGKVEGMKN